MSERIHTTQTEDVTTRTRKSGESTSAGPTKKQIQRAIANPTPNTLTPAIISRLHKTHGNQFVNRLVQRMPAGSKRLSHPIQAKLTVTPADDQYEAEADSAAKDAVQAIRSGDVQRMDDDEMMMKRDTLQRMDDDEMMMKRDTLQRMDVDFYDGGDVSGDVENQIESARGGGQPLEDGVRNDMESAFGADFSNVRVHTGSQADTLNDAVQAKAFTTGSDIFFKSGEYNPNSNGGQELLAHELTHTIQQGSVGVQKKEDDTNS